MRARSFGTEVPQDDVRARCGKFEFPMKDIASWALNSAALRGASYSDARIADDRHRALSTKNGKVGSASVSESFGF
jgi:hypothetical protein